jgi:hypothetical protein
MQNKKREWKRDIGRESVCCMHEVSGLTCVGAKVLIYVYKVTRTVKESAEAAYCTYIQDRCQSFLLANLDDKKEMTAPSISLLVT